MLFRSEPQEHRAFDDADGERRQDQRADRRTRVVPPAAGEPLGGQPSQPDREDDDEHHARPDRGHGGERLGADAQRGAVGTSAAECRKDAERDAEREGYHQRQHAEGDGDLGLRGQLVGDRRAGEERGTEVAAEDPADPVGVLQRERTVQPEALPDRRDLLGRRRGAADQLGDVSRQHAEGREDEHAGDEEACQ